MCLRPDRDERGRLLPGHTANPRGRPPANRYARLFALAAELGAVVVGPCVRTERCTDLSEKVLLFSGLLVTLVEARAQRPSSWITRETPRKRASLPHRCSAKR